MRVENPRTGYRPPHDPFHAIDRADEMTAVDAILAPVPTKMFLL